MARKFKVAVSVIPVALEVRPKDRIVRAVLLGKRGGVTLRADECRQVAKLFRSAAKAISGKRS